MKTAGFGKLPGTCSPLESQFHKWNMGTLSYVIVEKDYLGLSDRSVFLLLRLIPSSSRVVHVTTSRQVSRPDHFGR
ncbi:hypothetical protein GGP41_001644 [Bipolaris sorokiniana]|uniref:Uncharacterized protein n=1 Tax=Cochliobolus sativus TaxID=45130 RepID=A0A8H5ZP96_COCSA|nr:hypothetical protein GGP41_001644 [Bipolaris sorokiniana]